MNEAAAFLEAIRLNPDDDTARLVFADWLDENHPATPVAEGELPKGFNAYWHANALGYTLGRQAVRAGRGKWANWEIVSAFQDLNPDHTRWFDHAGATTIAGYPVLVSEPYLDDRSALDICRILQPLVAGCPVTFSRRAAHFETCVRIGIWFTAMPPEEQLRAEGMERVAAALDQMFGGVTHGVEPPT